ncbi:replication initiator protein A [Streptococcus suis]|uniref:Replication initiator protein A n=2 Tax=Streptococcus suis TaxID=1307 RepID=A0AAW5LIX8_STRSU|nr:replication initiator protein A [Streptococcus suis]MBL6515090.1 replication initiator protein A [Streptococcus suis]MCK4024094.1 replication initiator protein A [Streptococcus suis]MCK4051376.1 replication initiator protein A [Streptococcus suis]MCR1231945.1 replication initiator protein A [Streptococcus suis]MDG4509792.1 replication initiator protein A [Streptococcus suis]
MRRISVEQVQTSERFYRIPKVLVESVYYRQMSTESKFTYAILKDRFELSLKNNWVDENGDVYLIFTVEELQSILGYGKNKVIKIKKELAEYGLLEEVRQGLNKPNLLYLGNVTSDLENVNSDFPQAKPLPEAEVSKSNFQKFQNQTSRSSKNKLQEVSGPNSNDTNLSDPDISEYSSRKAGADTPTPDSSGEEYIKPEYYSLLQVIANKYNDRYLYPEGYALTHSQKMQIGQYLASGYVLSNEVLDLIDQIPHDCQSPLAYLLKSLENLREERRLEEKMNAHRQAQEYYAG